MVVFRHLFLQLRYPASILYKSIAGRYRPVNNPDGPISGSYRLIKNAYWDNFCNFLFAFLRVHLFLKAVYSEKKELAPETILSF